MSSLLTLLFAPSFLLLTHFFKFQELVFTYIIIALFFLLYAYVKKRKTEDFVILAIYLVLLSLAYYFDNFETVKFIPVLSAMTFFTIFALSAMHNNEIIYKFTTKVYKKKLSDGEIKFLKKGDRFWAVAIFIYAMFLLYLVYYSNDAMWAFFSSIGWYIYFGVTLFVQVTYGKLYAIKLSS